ELAEGVIRPLVRRSVAAELVIKCELAHTCRAFRTLLLLRGHAVAATWSNCRMQMYCRLSFSFPALPRHHLSRLLVLAMFGVVTFLGKDALSQEVLKVATFNLYPPGLSARAPADRNAVLDLFGNKLLSQADIALVQEDGDNSWTERLSQASGL